MKYLKRLAPPMLFIFCCLTWCSAQPKASATVEPYFNADAREVIQPTSLATDKISATSIGSVLTLLFQDARVSLQSPTDPLIATWVGTVRIPTRPGTHPAKFYIQHIRGSVDKTVGARVTLVFSLGGRTYTKEYPYGTKSTGDTTLKFVVPIRPQGAEGYVATMAIIVERRDAKSAALVDIDSLDVDARSTLTAKKK